MSSTHPLVLHLLKYGKNESWDSLADKFDFKNGELARNHWLRYRKNIGTATYKPSQTEEISTATYSPSTSEGYSFTENIGTNTAEITVNSIQEIKSLDELIEKTSIDLSKWKIEKWIQNFWNNMYQVKAWLKPNVPTEQECFTNKFIEFLDTYRPEYKLVEPPDSEYGGVTLLINKQDAHLNKFDINGNNDIDTRLTQVELAIGKVASKAAVFNNLEMVYYVIGSDQFNSEWNSMTTKGTPQTNAIDFHTSFTLICQHEVNIISELLSQAEEVQVVYVSGNHDEYIGWHLIHWLQAYFREEQRVFFDISPEYRKYYQSYNTAIMLNHGDAIKPEKLVSIFPMEAKAAWSECDHFYIFTGDKHHMLSKDFNGIEFHQLPALGSAVSKWDDKNGHVGAWTGVTGFLIEPAVGRTDTYRVAL